MLALMCCAGCSSGGHADASADLCVGSTSDPNNCGSCGNVCPLAMFCLNGTCMCPLGSVQVGDSCTPCGDVGMMCCANATCYKPFNICLGSRCCVKPNAGCSADADCCTGTLLPAGQACVNKACACAPAGVACLAAHPEVCCSGMCNGSACQ
jgi:hypothetical protein